MGGAYGMYGNYSTGQSAMNSAATLAIVNNGSMLITDTNSGAVRSFDAAPGGWISGSTYQASYVYPFYMAIYFADTLADLATSTTYCTNQNAALCYQSGTYSGSGTINLTGMNYYQIRYYDFMNTFRAANPGVHL